MPLKFYAQKLPGTKMTNNEDYLQVEAQDHQLVVVDPAHLMPLEVSLPMEMDNTPPENPVEDQHHFHSHQQNDEDANDQFSMLEVNEPVEVELVVDDLPGAPQGTKDPEPLEVVDQVMEEPKDENQAKTSDKWDWKSKGAKGFVSWVQEMLDRVPKHSGYDTAGLERAIAYYDRVDNEISKAMRMDLDGELDGNQVEKVRAKLDEGKERLQNRLDKVKDTKKSNKKRKKTSEEDVPQSLIKEGQKILGVGGVYITVPLLISGIARVCVNGVVSGGHDLGDLFQRQCEKYKLNDREKSEVKWLLFDLGMPIRGDRGYYPDNEEYDLSSSDNFDYAANYKG